MDWRQESWRGCTASCTSTAWRNGTALFLPYDQGLEHGPRDFFANPDAADPRYIAPARGRGRLQRQSCSRSAWRRSSIWDYAGEVPLILKLNGKTDIPPDDEALSPLHACVEDAVRLGADAVGYTLYVGTPAAAADFAQYRQVRSDAERLGMPLIVWAYPRGSAIEAKGGQQLVLRRRLRRPDRRASWAPTW